MAATQKTPNHVKPLESINGINETNQWKYHAVENIFLPAQLAPVNPVKQVQIPVELSQVPWVGSVQSSGQVRSFKENSLLGREIKVGSKNKIQK